jgi:hypothetical protein
VADRTEDERAELARGITRVVDGLGRERGGGPAPAAMPYGDGVSPHRARPLRGALAGAVAAGVWAAVEPLSQRLLGTRYSDVRLLGRMVSAGRAWPAAGAAVHVANGAVFGAAFALLGGRGVAAGIAAAQAENAVLWPAFLVAQRVHPDARSGYWGCLVCDRKVIAHEVAMHALFGAILGAALRD